MEMNGLWEKVLKVKKYIIEMGEGIGNSPLVPKFVSCGVPNSGHILILVIFRNRRDLLTFFSNHSQ